MGQRHKGWLGAASRTHCAARGRGPRGVPVPPWVSSKRNFADFGANARNDDITAARANARNNAKPVTALRKSPPRAPRACARACARADKRQQNSKDLVRCYQDQPSPLTHADHVAGTYFLADFPIWGRESGGLRWACARVRARGANLVPCPWAWRSWVNPAKNLHCGSKCAKSCRRGKCAKFFGRARLYWKKKFLHPVACGHSSCI